jgi:hypothetical protein
VEGRGQLYVAFWITADHPDYLLYSRLHLPTLHLSGLLTTRLTPTLQAHLAFLCPPSPRTRSPHSRQPSDPAPLPSASPGNLLLSLQHDTGRYAGEYTYSAQDGMFGWRGLYNFGWHEGEEVRQDERRARVDEEEMMDGGLKGRFSAGGEVYFSAQQRSFGSEHRVLILPFILLMSQYPRGSGSQHFQRQPIPTHFPLPLRPPH